MHTRQLAGLGLALCLGGLAAVPTAHAAQVGNIVAFYNAPNPYGVGVIDGPAFVFNNTSGSAITDGVFTIGANTATPANSFLVGTIAAGSDFLVIPGVTNDGQPGHTFFDVIGGVLDTSNSGPADDSTPFMFTGLLNGQAVDTGVFTPGTTSKPSGDTTISQINFLGGGPQSDGPCNDCYDPSIVATINTASPAVPEPAAFALLALGVLPLFAFVRRRA